MKSSRLLIIAAVSTVAAAALGWFRPVPQDVPPASLHSESWGLPSKDIMDRSSAALASQARTIRWGSGSSTGGGAAITGESSWALLGVVLDRGVPTALVRTADKPEILRIVAGGTLPDGSRLVTVERGAVIMEAGGCRKRRPVYSEAQQDDSNSADACAAPQGNKEPGKS